MSDIKNTINKKGNRLTKQRIVILEYLKSVTCHPDAEKIHQEVKKKLPNISLGTVYRNLSYLAENSFILQLNATDGKMHYDGDISYHGHFLCITCGTIYDIFDLDNITIEKIKDIGKVYKIECNIYGTCQKCLKNK